MPETADLFVIIPFFQRTPGLLARAVRSVLAQGLGARCRVIVVDDSSPCSAEQDLAGFAPEDRATVTIIRQPNGGAGAARNTGLDAVPAHARVVAFLDSDDAWSEDHLARALAAIDAGAELYFAKTAGMDDLDAPSDDAWPGKAETQSSFTVPDTITLNEQFLAYTIRRGLPLQTLVVRAALCRSIRFATHLHRAGEDLTFTLALTRVSRLNVFSDRVEASLGRGVNIYRSTLTHGSPDAIPRLLDEVQSRLDLANQVREVPLLARENARMRTMTLSGLAVQMLHAARRGRVRSLMRIARYVAVTPTIVGPLAKETVRACLGRIRSPS
jgi:succinoglycan biosynthesis protein ExoW